MGNYFSRNSTEQNAVSRIQAQAFSTETNFQFEFSRQHTKGRAQWFVDGKDYMEAVADAILNAREEIYITDWQMNHHIYLKRPDSKNADDWEQWRLGNLLKKKASEGVKVYILLYREPSHFMQLGSKFTMEELHDPPRINVYRHRRHFISRYSHHEKLVVVDQKIAFMGGLDLCYGRWDTHEHKLNDNPKDKQAQCWRGKDYKNTFLMKKDYSEQDYEKPDEDYMDRSVQPRMPWHDVACCVEGPVVTDLARHFVQRYNQESPQKWIVEIICLKQNVLFYPFATLLLNLIPSSYDGVTSEETPEPIYPWYFDWIYEVKIHSSPKHPLPFPKERNWDHLPKLQCQAVRSYWSKHVDKEASIQAAYHALIEKAEDFIYIENQFFISSLKGTLVNTVVRSLGDRIIRAHKEGNSFKVIIVIPLKPEMLGTWENSAELTSVAYLNYATICRQDDSLFKRLADAGITNVSDYVSFFGLRTHDMLNGRPVTEIVYVHTKLMIVDDKCTIMGSANINDRSMVGDRDSELAMIIENKEFSHGLRCQLTREHLGLEADDELAENFEASYAEFMKQARTNTEIYERVFGKEIELVDDVIKLQDLKERKALGPSLAERNPREACTQLKGVRGHVVCQPLNFLRDYLRISNWYRLPWTNTIVKGTCGPDQQLPDKQEDCNFHEIC